MTRLSETLGPPLHDDTGDPSSVPAAYEATVTAVNGQRLSVVVPGYSGSHDFTNLRYLAPTGSPAVDDQVVVVFTDDREPVVLAPGSGIRKYATTVGDGVATSIVVTHNLGTRDVAVTVRDVASPYEVVGVTWQATTTNTVTVIFGSAPASASRRVVVVG